LRDIDQTAMQSDPPALGSTAGSELRFVLITPARDEAAYIDATIRSVIAQTLRPSHWIIVSDGSTDGTDDIVRQHAAVHHWIQLVRAPERAERSFAGKVQAFEAGRAQLPSGMHDIIGSLDADITLEPDCFAVLLTRFTQQPRLGVAGAPFRDANHRYDYRFTSIEHVSGACQLFRRECFEAIGGYTPVKGGGVDWIAVASARMKGWQTRTFPETFCTHHRPMGTAQTSTLGASFRLGRKDYRLGGHPLWQAFRSLYQVKTRPYLLSGLLLAAGFSWDWARRADRVVSPELQRFHRGEQMRRLRTLLTRRIGNSGSRSSLAG
jgi:poly-beta-1,6-N-acetyl-D-glucosamine synthase